MSEPISPGKSGRTTLNVAAPARPRKAFTASLVQARGDASPNTRRDDDRSDNAAPQTFAGEAEQKQAAAALLAETLTTAQGVAPPPTKEAQAVLAEAAPLSRPPEKTASDDPPILASVHEETRPVPSLGDIGAGTVTGKAPVPEAGAVQANDLVVPAGADKASDGALRPGTDQKAAMAVPGETVRKVGESAPHKDAVPERNVHQPVEAVAAGPVTVARPETSAPVSTPVVPPRGTVDPSRQQVSRTGLFAWLSKVGRPLEKSAGSTGATKGTPRSATADPPHMGDTAPTTTALPTSRGGVKPDRALPDVTSAAPVTEREVLATPGTPKEIADGVPVATSGDAQPVIVPVQTAPVVLTPQATLPSAAAQPVSALPTVQSSGVSEAIAPPVLTSLPQVPVPAAPELPRRALDTDGLPDILPGAEPLPKDRMLPVPDSAAPLVPQWSFLSETAKIRRTEIAISAPDVPALAQQPEMRQAAAFDIVEVSPLPEPVPHMYWGETPRIFPQQVSAPVPSGAMANVLPQSVQLAGVPQFGSAAMNIGRMTFQQTALPMRIVYDVTSTRRWWLWYRNYTQVQPRVTYTIRGDLLPGTATEFERR